MVRFRDSRDQTESKAIQVLGPYNLSFTERKTMNFEFDAYDHKIIALLQENARLSYTEIGRKIHLTSPAVTERVKRLEEAGVIEGYCAKINTRKIGYSFEAFVHVTVDSHAALDSWAAAQIGRAHV